MRFALFSLLVLVISSTTRAQADDDLAPLAPKKQKPPAPARPKPKPQPKPVGKPKVDDDDLAPIAVAKGELVIKLPQALTNATVAIDGKDLGAFPIQPQSLPPGEHTVRVRRLGFAEFTKKVVVLSGKSIEVEAKLTATHAVVSVNSDVPEAQVFINGKLAGIVPLKEVEVLPGLADLAVRKDGFAEDKQKVNLVPGKDYSVAVKLPPIAVAVSDRPVDAKLVPDEVEASRGTAITEPMEQPLTTRPVFWVGVAAAAVGVAVLSGVAIANSQQPQKLDEKTVCGERCDICVGFTCGGSLLKF